MEENKSNETKPEKLYWALLRLNHMKQTSGLRFEQAQFIVALIPPDDFDSWMAWYEGLPEWKPLSYFKNLIENSDGTPIYAPPIPPAHKDSPSDVQIDMRVSTRFLKEFEVKVLSPFGKAFDTTTVNISPGGMLLASSVPSEIGQNFKCRISTKKGDTLDIFCSIVKTDSTRKHIKFIEVSRPRVLLSWLVDSQVR